MGSRLKPNFGGDGSKSSRLRDFQQNRYRVWKRGKESKTNSFMCIEDVNAYIDNNELECLLCNNKYKSLYKHLSATHCMSGDEYRDMFNIPRQYSLYGNELLNLRKEIMKNTWEKHPELREFTKKRARGELQKFQKKSGIIAGALTRKRLGLV